MRFLLVVVDAPHILVTSSKSALWYFFYFPIVVAYSSIQWVENHVVSVFHILILAEAKTLGNFFQSVQALGACVYGGIVEGFLCSREL